MENTIDRRRGGVVGDAHDIDLNELVDKVHRDAEQSASKPDVAFIVRKSAPAPRLRWSNLEVFIAVSMLMQNAVEALGDQGGRVTLRTVVRPCGARGEGRGSGSGRGGWVA